MAGRTKSCTRVGTIVACIGLCLLRIVFPATAQTSTYSPELVIPVPSNQLTDFSPAQTQAIERLQKRATTDDLRLVTVNIDALKGDELQVNVPKLANLSLSKRSEDVRSASDFTWYGSLSGMTGQATLIVHGGNITGSIQGEDGLYRIEPVGNGVHALIKVDTNRLPQEHPPTFKDRERRG